VVLALQLLIVSLFRFGFYLHHFIYQTSITAEKIYLKFIILTILHGLYVNIIFIGFKFLSEPHFFCSGLCPCTQSTDDRQCYNTLARTYPQR